jgi:hypothetical protein
MHLASIVLSHQASFIVTAFAGFLVLTSLVVYFLFLARALIVAIDSESSAPRKIFWIIVCLSIPPLGLLIFKVHEGHRKQIVGIVSSGNGHLPKV